MQAIQHIITLLACSSMIAVAQVQDDALASPPIDDAENIVPVQQHDADQTWSKEALVTEHSSVLSEQLVKSDGSSLRLGFVNLRRVMASIPQLTNLRARLDSEFAQQKATLEQQNNEIQSMEKELATMPRGDAYSELEKQVIAKRRIFARLDASYRDAYSVRRNEELATLQQLVVDEIVGLAKDEGYDVILNDIGVIFVSSHTDLSQMVIDRLQKRANQGEHDH